MHGCPPPAMCLPPMVCLARAPDLARALYPQLATKVPKAIKASGSWHFTLRVDSANACALLPDRCMLELVMQSGIRHEVAYFALATQPQPQLHPHFRSFLWHTHVPPSEDARLQGEGTIARRGSGRSSVRKSGAQQHSSTNLPDDRIASQLQRDDVGQLAQLLWDAPCRRRA